jgi:hypothetical protein
MSGTARPCRRDEGLDGTVIGRNTQRHHHQQFIRFLKCRSRGVFFATS